MPSSTTRPGAGDSGAREFAITEQVGDRENTLNPTQSQSPALAAPIIAASAHLSQAERLAAAIPPHLRAALVEAVGRAQEFLAAALGRVTTSATSERQRGEGGPA
jgi:hypothetical protein